MIEKIFDNVQERAEERELKSEADPALEEETRKISEAYDSIDWQGLDFDVLSEGLSHIEATKRGIDWFCKLLPFYRGTKHFRKSGFFIGGLVQNAYANGENDFVIDLAHLPFEIDHFCECIHGTKDNPLKIEIHGNLSWDCARYADYCHFVFNDKVMDWCGAYATHSYFDFRGDLELFYKLSIKARYGLQAKYCTFISHQEGLLDVLGLNTSIGSRIYLRDGENLTLFLQK